MWLSSFIVTSSNGERVSPWNIPLWIFASSKLFRPAVNSSFQVFMVFSIKFMTSSDILYILRQFIIQLCGAISYAFLYWYQFYLTGIFVSDVLMADTNIKILAILKYYFKMNLKITEAAHRIHKV